MRLWSMVLLDTHYSSLNVVAWSFIRWWFFFFFFFCVVVEQIFFFFLEVLYVKYLTLVLRNPHTPCLANSIGPDANSVDPEEANWSESALFLLLSLWIYINNLNQVVWLAEG